MSEALRDLASEYRLAVSYALEVLSEIEALLEAEDRRVLRAIVTSMRDELDAHIALSYLLEEAARVEEREAVSRNLPEPWESEPEPIDLEELPA